LGRRKQVTDPEDWTPEEENEDEEEFDFYLD
jgi:hypothetical protein